RIDGAASIVIGVILGIVAALLAREAKGLLIGEGADPAVVAKVRAIVAARPEITAVNHVRTIHTAPDSIFVAISADFRDQI
ncbi:cation transporter, partial [Pseudomonas sp. FW301-21B01]